MTQHQHKLVAGQSRHHILAAHDVAQTPGHLDQQHIAAGMTVAIVDRLKTVEIKHAHRQRDVFLSGHRQCLIQSVREIRSIGQSGQRVMPYPPLQDVQQLALFTDVEPNRQVSIDPSGGIVEHRHHGAVDPVKAAVLGAIADFPFHTPPNAMVRHMAEKKSVGCWPELRRR